MKNRPLRSEQEVIRGDTNMRVKTDLNTLAKIKLFLLTRASIQEWGG